MNLDAYRTPDRLAARIALHERFGAHVPDFHRAQFDRVLEELGPRAQAGAPFRVLEVGVGTGRLWNVNAERVPGTWQLTLLDRSAGMVAEARTMLRTTGLSGEALEADAAALPFDGATFDLAFANHMLYHVPDIARAVAELRRVLKPGATLFAATNGAEHMRPLREALQELQALAPELRIDAGERLRFDLETGATWLQGAFDEVERVDASDDLLVPEVEPLMAYLGSTIHLPDPMPPDLAARVKRWDRATRQRFGRLLEHGPVRVPRATGYFVAR